jgi:hypothetical protein
MLRVIRFACLSLALPIISVAAGAIATSDAALPARDASAPPTITATARFNRSYEKLPLNFERNEGQTDQRVKFLARGRGYSLFLTPTEAVLALRKPAEQTRVPGAAFSQLKEQKLADMKSEEAVLHISLAGANRDPKIDGIDSLPGKVNYFVGHDPAKWRTNVMTYSSVKYRDIYRGVDLIYHGSDQRQLEYDFVLAPGADPRRIELSFAGANRLRLDADGNLVVSIAGGEIVEHRPVVYQDIGGIRRRVAGGYELTNGHTVAFKLAVYDHRQSLTIDPSLAYSTYLGGSGEDRPNGSNSIAVDSSGNVYVVGITDSSNFPTTAGALQTTNAGGYDAFVSKLNSSGSALIYSTYLGGSGDDYGNSIAVDSSNNAYVIGFTNSSNFPTTAGAFQTSNGGGSNNAFVSKLNSSGSALIYSTYLGGSGDDVGTAIAVDSSGNAYVAGATDSSNFPITAGAFQTTLAGAYNAFVSKLNRGGSALVYSTFLGGNVQDYGEGIAVDSSGNAYVTGYTESSNFPTTAGALQTTYGGGFADVFVTKLNSSGSTLDYSTYLGGSGNDNGNGIAVDSSGNAYVVGITDSSNFPTTAGAFQTTNAGGYDAFVSKLNSSGSALIYSTYLGGSGNDNGQGIGLDSSGDAYVSGGTSSTDFPTTAGAFQTTLAGSQNAFVSKLNGSGSALTYSAYLGGSGNDDGLGIAVDSAGNAYVFGLTDSSNFPTTPGAFQTTFGGGAFDAFVTKIALGPLCTVTYNGTFNGNLNISSGLVCIINGTVTGNVTENGGGLFTSNATIGGNLQITGGGTLSMASTAVSGDLQIQNIPAGSAQNQICGSQVKGNLTFHNNGTAVAIGTTSASCPGDTIGNDLQVNNNTAAVQVFDDTAGGNLQCQNNSSITGGGDSAKSLQGQCASF